MSRATAVLPPDDTPIRIGVSSCLLGEPVRYDGGHKRDAYITRTLARLVELVPICPEMAIGLGVPRPPIQLVGDPAAPRAVGVVDPSLDVTQSLAAYGRQTAHRLDDISGYLLKSRSPSCGMERVKVQRARSMVRAGRGIFASALMTARPLLPVEEDGRLADPLLRDNFWERVFAYARWRTLHAGSITRARLMNFHNAHILTLVAHGASHDAALGRLLSDSKKSTATAYGRRFMQALARPVTIAGHARALQYVLTRLEPRLNLRERNEVRRSIVRYRAGELSWLTTVKRLRRYPDPWIASQVYLYPDARELALRFRRR
ncbi:MAG: DUF1722 domain-containing protein [Gammaproteobacteria bacterium]|nr:DUF1722 domain-containing protein [Gammaproteobacteria bacterium]